MRRATEASEAELLATKENQSAIMQSLVAEVAAAYFDLREYDLELEYVRASLVARQDSVKLVKARQQGGVATMLEVDQAVSLVATAQANIALLERAAEQTENLIQFLLGKLPGRGFYVSADRALIEKATKKGLFARAARQSVKLPDGLVDLVEQLLLQRVIDLLSMARKAGDAVTGYEKVKDWLTAAKAVPDSVTGVMYTTWENKYGELEAFSRAIDEVK